MNKRNSTAKNLKSWITIALTAFINVFSSQAAMALCSNATALEYCSFTSDNSTVTVDYTGCQAVPPCIPSPSYPANGAGNICNPTIALAWPVSPGATEYDLYFGTSNPPLYYATTTNTSFTVNNISIGTNYWQVRPRNSSGVASGCNVWTFSVVDCTPPCVASPTYPANGAGNICNPTTTLTWPASAGAAEYDLYFGTSNPPVYYATTTNPSFTVNNISIGTNYWQVRPRNSSGVASGCNVWTFSVVDCTPLCVASPTYPANGAGNICPSPTTTLTWPISTGATNYDLYFGTTNPPVYYATTANPSFTINNISTGTFYWRIRPRNNSGVASGCNVWTFVVVNGSFVLPPNGASQVACPSAIVQPTPPSVVTNCGSPVSRTGPTITNNPNPITCEGTRTYTWTYDNLLGQINTWSHVVTVERQPFTLPANGGSAVACPDETDGQPTPPVVTSNCGEVLMPVITSTAKPGCEGNRNWYFTYTDCEGNTATWTYIYTIEYLDFTVPASETVTVNCPLNASQPVPPVVKDNCNNMLTPTGPVITTTTLATGCEGSRKYTWTYQDCEGTSHTWSKTFNFAYPGGFFVYPDGEDYVSCLLYAQPPVPPTIYGNCGEELTVLGPTVTGSDDGCSGTKKFTYTYVDCGGYSVDWNFTYHADDNEPPVGTIPNVDVTNLTCIEDVPCPGSYDFSSKMAELIAAGNIHDVCSGNDLNVELDSWSALWECTDADPSPSGVNYTFGRTFYFRISDQCGNEFPSLCGVTYAGQCQPLVTFLQADWGIEGNEPGNSTPTNSTDLQTISTLLGQGPLVIGGSHRSLTLTDAQCVLNLLPGVGNPTVLGNCTQTNCNGCNPAGPVGMKNSLATNTISLALNMRFNVQYQGLTMPNLRNQGLGCIAIDPNIKFCSPEGICKLHVFEANGTEHQFPYTLGGLLDLANLYLDGNLSFSIGEKLVYAAALNKSILNVNTYWQKGQAATACSPSAGANATADSGSAKAFTTDPSSVLASFSLAPNPATGEVTIRLAQMPMAQNLSLAIYNPLGQVVLRKDFGSLTYLNERIDLSDIEAGLYFVTMKAGNVSYSLKLMVSKN